MINEYSKERVFVRRYRIIVLNAISEKLPQRKSFCLGKLRTVGATDKPCGEGVRTLTLPTGFVGCAKNAG